MRLKRILKKKKPFLYIQAALSTVHSNAQSFFDSFHETEA